MDELSKSLKAFLYDRATSPLYGTFIMTWCIWNWKILYLTFVTSSEAVPDKIGFIQSYYVDWLINLLYPLISTVVILVAFPWLSIGAKWITLFYDNKKREIANSFEREQLLSKEESIAVRLELQQEKSKFAAIMASKDKDFDILNKAKGDLERDIKKMRVRDGLIIYRADYGKGGMQKDVTTEINKMISGQNINGFRVDPLTLGVDPLPGRTKELRIIYSMNGVFECRTFNEGETINI